MTKLPMSFRTKFTELLGQADAEQLFTAIDNETKKAFRLNPLKPNFEQVSLPLTEPLKLIDDAYVGQINGRSVEQLAGYVYSQDPAAMYVAQVAAVQPGEYVLDLCAAPGGKTTQLASGMLQKGILVANEINQGRAKILLENVERSGIKNAVVLNESPQRLSPVFANFFDKIVVDAPCSGEGMFRKDPGAVEYWSPDYVLTCQARQKEIVTEAYKMLKPGGRLIYSTCTFSPEEDEQIVEFLLEEFSDLELVPIELHEEFDPGRPEWGTSGLEALKYTARFWPQKGFGEGQYVAVLQKKAAENESGKTVALTDFKRSKVDWSKTPVPEFLQALNQPKSLFSFDKLELSNEHVFLPILNPAALKGIRVLRNGLELGEIKKKRFVPHHHFAQALDVDITPAVELTSEVEFEKFAHGEALPVTTDVRGYCLVAYQGKAFSWGKIGQDKILKNFYPKGLRL